MKDIFSLPKNLLLTEHKMLKTYYQCLKPLINAYNIQSMLKTFNQIHNIYNISIYKN